MKHQNTRTTHQATYAFVGATLASLIAFVSTSAQVAQSTKNVYAQAGNSSPGDIDFVQGMKLLDEQHYERAIPFLSAAIRANPKNWSALGHRGYAYIEAGAEEKALLDLNKAIELNSNDFFSRMTRADAYTVFGDWEKALVDLQICQRLQPNNASVYNQLGNVYAAKKDWTKAIDSFGLEAQLARNPRIAMVKRAAAYLAIGHYDDAIRDYSNLIKKNPKDLESMENMVNTLNKMGKTDQAVLAIGEYLKTLPDNRSLLWSRSKLYFQQKSYDKAIADLSKLIEKRKQDDDALLLRAECFLEVKLFEKAIRDLTNCIELDEGSAMSAYKLRGKAYRAVGKSDLAKSDFEKFDRLNAKIAN